MQLYPKHASRLWITNSIRWWLLVVLLLLLTSRTLQVTHAQCPAGYFGASCNLTKCSSQQQWDARLQPNFSLPFDTSSIAQLASQPNAPTIVQNALATHSTVGQFDGVSQYVDLTLLSFPLFGASNCSFSVWFSFDDLLHYWGGVFSFASDKYNGQDSLQLGQYGSTSSLFVWSYVGTQQTSYAYTDEPTRIATWYHATLVLSTANTLNTSCTLLFYLNSAVTFDYPRLRCIQYIARAFCTLGIDSYDKRFRGSIDGFQFYNYALSSIQISSLFTTQHFPIPQLQVATVGIAPSTSVWMNLSFTADAFDPNTTYYNFTTLPPVVSGASIAQTGLAQTGIYKQLSAPFNVSSNNIQFTAYSYNTKCSTLTIAVSTVISTSCQSSPCVNTECTSMFNNDYSCACAVHSVGKNCEISLCSSEATIEPQFSLTFEDLTAPNLTRQLTIGAFSLVNDQSIHHSFAKFNGNQVVDLNAIPGTPLPMLSRAFTISIHMQIGALVEWQAAWDLGNHAPSYASDQSPIQSVDLSMYFATAQPCIEVYPGRSDNRQRTVGSAMSLNQWYHLVAVINVTSVALYQNYVNYFQLVQSSPIFPSQPISRNWSSLGQFA